MPLCVCVACKLYPIRWLLLYSCSKLNINSPKPQSMAKNVLKSNGQETRKQTKFWTDKFVHTIFHTNRPNTTVNLLRIWVLHSYLPSENRNEDSNNQRIRLWYFKALIKHMRVGYAKYDLHVYQTSSLLTFWLNFDVMGSSLQMFLY